MKKPYRARCPLTRGWDEGLDGITKMWRRFPYEAPSRPAMLAFWDAQVVQMVVGRIPDFHITAKPGNDESQEGDLTRNQTTRTRLPSREHH